MDIFKVKKLMNIKKILLFGSTGMVGSNIKENIKFKDYNFACPRRDEVDLRNPESIANYISVFRPDLIINVAGMVGGIMKNSKNNYEFLLNNTLINLNLINQSYKLGVSNFLNVSSSCIYPKDFTSQISEDSILTGLLEPTNEGYAISKILSLKMCNYLFSDKNLNFKTLIPTNLYGPFDNFDPDSSHMIPGVIKRIHDSKLSNNNSIEIWGDGKARREFMYVEDFADFIYFSIENFESIPSILNVGLGEDYSINEYYEIISNTIGFDGKFTFDLTKPVGMKRKLLDISNLRELGWKNTTSLKEGIEKTYNYFLENYGN
jgi:GDP-L-fucose synthase